MKHLTIALIAVLAVAVTASDAMATNFFRGRSTFVSAGGVNVAVQNRGLFGRRNFVNVNAPGVNVNVANRGLFGRRNVVNVNAVPFRNNVNVVAVNGRHFNNFNNVRVNAFGTRTFVSNGNVFEVDAFGNHAFRGNAFNRGFGYNGFSAVNRSFFAFPQQQVFFNNGCFNGSCNTGFAVRSFGGCR